MLDRRDARHILENACVLVVATAMFIYGFAKPVQFNAPPPETALGDLTPMQLMWAFYAHSMPFAILLGVMEVLGGVLLLIPRTRVLGALLLTGILSQVILQDVFYGVLVGALRAAIVYLVLTLLVLWWHRHTLLRGLRALTSVVRTAAPRRKRLLRGALALLVAVVLKWLEVLWTHSA